MRILKKLGAEQQAPLFMTDVGQIEKNFQDKVSFFKKLVHWRIKKKIEELLEGKQIQPLGVKELIKELDSVLMMRNEVKKPVGSMAEIPKEVKPKIVEKIVEVEKVVEVEKQEFSKEEILELVQKECNKEWTFLNWLVGNIV